jgi:hypothetical protein
MRDPNGRRPPGHRQSLPVRPRAIGPDHASLFTGFAERLASLINGASARPGKGRRDRRAA